MTRQNKIGLTILLVALVIASVNSFYFKPLKRKKIFEVLKVDGIKVMGRVDKVIVSSLSGGHFSIDFSFLHQGKRYEGSKSVSCVMPSKKQAKVFEGKSYTVMYSKKDPDVHLLLIGRKEYEQFGLAFPDSLREVSRIYFDCLD